MTSVIIQDIIPKTQLVSTAGQTVFNTIWTADATTDIDVYARLDGVEPNDVIQLVSPSDYVVTFIGASETVRVTFAIGRTLNEVITIVRDTPSTRLNLYTNTNFTPSMINNDIEILTLVDQQSQLYDQEVAPHYNVSATIEPIIDVILPILGPNQIWAKNNADTAIIAYDVPAGGGLAPDNGTYLLQIADTDLPNAQVMGALASGFVVNTTVTGVQLTRLLAGVTNQTVITNVSGLAGNPTFGIASNPTIPGTEYILLPSGTTAQRPGSPNDGMVRYNTTLKALEVYNSSYWDALAGGILDSVIGTLNQIDVDNTDPQNPIVGIANNPILPGTGGETLPTGTTAQRVGGAGTMRFNSQILEFEGTTDGIAWNSFQTSAGTILSVTGTANQVDVTAGANPVVGLSSTLNLPGTLNIQSTTAINAIINDSTLVSATSSNIATAAALKTYIDNIATGFNVQGSCVCASTTALTATYANGTAGVGATLTNAGAFAAIQLDSVSPTVGQRVLIKDQASSLQNGIYTVTTIGNGVSVNWVLTRATDFDTPSEIQPGDLVVLTGGTTQNQSSWLQTATVSVVGTDTITFVQFTASLPIAVKNGGTGKTSFTAYAPIVGGTTTTGVLQSVGLGAAGTLFKSAGVGALPGFTTTTYPTTNAINTIMYASSANALGVISPTNNGVLVYSAGGVPSSSTTLPSGLAATNMSLTTPSLGAATATSISFGSSALSSYESGSWTPTFSFVTPGNLSVSYVTQTGSYTRIGSFIIATFTLQFTPTFTTASGNVVLSGWPVASASSVYNNVVISTATYAAGRTQSYLYLNGSTANIGSVGSANSATLIGNSGISSGASMSIFGSIVYII